MIRLRWRDIRQKRRYAILIGGGLAALLIIQAVPLEKWSGLQRKQFAYFDRFFHAKQQEPHPLVYKVEKNVYIRAAYYDPRLTSVTLILYEARNRSLNCWFYDRNRQLQVSERFSQVSWLTNNPTT